MSEYLKPLSSVLDITGASQRDIENWIGRLQLATKFQQVGRGRQRFYSRANVLELSLVAALVASNIPPAVAAAYAESFLRRLQDRNFGELCKWLVVPCGDPTQAKAVSELNEAALEGLDLRGMPPVYTAINVAEIVERVDEAFADA